MITTKIDELRAIFNSITEYTTPEFDNEEILFLIETFFLNDFKENKKDYMPKIKNMLNSSPNPMIISDHKLNELYPLLEELINLICSTIINKQNERRRKSFP